MALLCFMTLFYIVIYCHSLLDSMTRENTMTLEEAEASLYDEEVPDQALQTKVTLEQLERVLHFGQQMRGDSHRFSVQVDPEDVFSRVRTTCRHTYLGHLLLVCQNNL